MPPGFEIPLTPEEDRLPIAVLAGHRLNPQQGEKSYAELFRNRGGILNPRCTFKTRIVN